MVEGKKNSPCSMDHSVRLSLGSRVSVLWLGAGWTIYDEVGRRSYSALHLSLPAVMTVLELCREKARAIGFLKDILKSSNIDNPASALAEMLTIGLLEISEPSADDQHWIANGWSDALRYRKHCLKIPLANYAVDGNKVDRQMMTVALRQRAPAPEPHLSMATGEPIALVRASDFKHRSMRTMLEERAPYDRVGSAMDSSELGWILWMAVGQRGVHEFPGVGWLPRKVVPSGGSRHPSDVYLILAGVNGLDSGLYFYASSSHTLQKMAVQSDLDLHLAGDPNFRLRRSLGASPTVTVLLTSVFARSAYRYKESRSYRVIHFDIGHITQNFTYVVRSLGRKLAADYTPREEILEPALGVNGISAALMTVMVIA